MSSDAVRTTFTLDFLDWNPWMERATETPLTPERRETVEAIVGTSNAGNYINVLANDLEALQARALVHRHVYSSEDPEPSAWRELGATTASRINGCVYCASVHARLYTKYTRRRDVALRFLAEGVDADLPEVERAVVDLAAKLSTDPESLTPADLEPLRQAGLDEMTILDVINYTAFFANANRLMLTLGEPAVKEE
ncbi:MAG: peroxidase-related enzyme [Thermomicrobiales bacterium]|nr:peroxidase-related enzyme [Thermomicrobiales bacterium]